LRLFGQEPAVCDHARTVGRIDLDRDAVQIVHVHGSYLFYDLANLRGEVTRRATADAGHSQTMVGLLDSVLWNRSPLVIGYSGWEGDIIMSALQRRLRGGHPLAVSMYWFAYRRSSLARLPKWLRDNPDVRFVVPDEAATDSARASTTGPIRSADATSALEQKTEPLLPAFTVLDRLNQEFQIGAPALFENPIKYYAQSLEASLPDATTAAGDPYAFKSLVERLYRLSHEWETVRTPEPPNVPLEALRECIRESRYPDAAAILNAIIPSHLQALGPEERQEVLDAAALSGGALFPEGDAGSLAPDGTLPIAPPYDIRVDRSLGKLPPGTVWCFGSRPGQYGSEKTYDGRPAGALTWHLVTALRDPSADIDGDGRISMLEAVIKCSAALRDEGVHQTPVLSGDADRIALFGAKSRRRRETGTATVHALLLGVGHFADGLPGLAGPAGDVELVAKLLATASRRLFTTPQVTSLIDADATKRAVEAAISALAAATEPADLLLLYFSGHGTREQRSTQDALRGTYSILLYDYREDRSGAMAHTEVMALLEPARAEQKLVIFDF
jgi:hypothetical protein